MIEIKVNEKLKIRQTLLEDAEDFFDIIEKNREYLRKYLPWLDSSRDLKRVEDSIIGSLREFKQSGTPRFSILFDNKIVGVIAFHPIDSFHKNASIGYWIDQDYSGKGLISKCAKVVVKFGFENLDLNRIFIRCHPDNIASQRIAEKLNFQLEGVLRESGKSIWHICR